MLSYYAKMCHYLHFVKFLYFARPISAKQQRLSDNRFVFFAEVSVNVRVQIAKLWGNFCKCYLICGMSYVPLNGENDVKKSTKNSNSCFPGLLSIYLKDILTIVKLYCLGAWKILNDSEEFSSLLAEVCTTCGPVFDIYIIPRNKSSTYCVCL